MNLTSRYLLILSLALCLFTACAQHPPASLTPTTEAYTTDTTESSTTIIKLVPNKINAQVGETLTVSIIVENVKDLYGVELHLSYDTSVWEIMDEDPQKEGLQILPGNFLSPDFIAINKVEPKAGSIAYAVVQLPPTKAVSGNGMVASLRFKVKTDDENALTLEQALLADQDGTPIPIKTGTF